MADAVQFWVACFRMEDGRPVEASRRGTESAADAVTLANASVPTYAGAIAYELTRDGERLRTVQGLTHVGVVQAAEFLESLWVAG